MQTKDRYRKTRYIQDLNFDHHYFVPTVLQVMLSALFFIMEGVLLFSPRILFNLQIGILIIATFSTFLGGFIIDYFKDLQKIQILTNFACSIIVLSVIWFPNVIIYAVLLLALFTPLSILIIVNIFMLQTSLLNRGRYMSILGFVMVFILGPFIVLIYLEINSNRFLTGIISIITIVIFLWERKYPIPDELILRRDIWDKEELKKQLNSNQGTQKENDIDQIENEPSKKYPRIQKISRIIFYLPHLTQNWLKKLNQSGFILYLTVNTIVYITSGCLFAILPIALTSLFKWGWFTFIFIMVLLIYGIIIDFYGRKPAIVTTIFILGIWILFFGQFKPLWYDAFVNYTLPFVIVGGIMCSGCIVGDFSNFYRRGRILGTILFSSLISLFIGYLSGLGLIFLAQQSEIIDLVQNPVIGHAFNFLSILILSSMVILIFTPETFDNKSIEWRKHLQQLFILTKDGLNLFYYDFLSVPDVKKEDVYDLDFSKREDDLQSTGDNWQKMMDSDLISSSLSGVQMLLKEISQSADNLRVLDHSDRKIFFSHGLQTTLVLFTTDYLPLYHELLAKFQDEFEYYNRDLLGSFVGSIPKWHFLKELMKKYFDINRAP